ncbi:hypothetical protein [Rugamonas sp. DEMB1]|uniref:hypothetical protein n=1 Tax=Rugamonas sp. DEMB1 TaxID=3039386 RepID=UPI002448606B|nr:hypothetical protein [Rugamonas sp. DEMB1]WGG48242.1 hypothetical protein QC826_16060 [Rugamonas sp. DEMB1]
MTLAIVFGSGKSASVGVERANISTNMQSVAKWFSISRQYFSDIRNKVEECHMDGSGRMASGAVAERGQRVGFRQRGKSSTLIFAK